ncbi:hypothetical protein CHS0354_029446 [Potamilus streckersoni]|uniref:Uncharacterized protein n=1 Tax=Potamilus streckersoni TaxID=2493646 RepID=A0AAE0SUD3_9BIVA|nr:hypothetical protein CHS0354_029446 [Potamilus streckersoni]
MTYENVTKEVLPTTTLRWILEPWRYEAELLRKSSRNVASRGTPLLLGLWNFSSDTRCDSECDTIVILPKPR